MQVRISPTKESKAASPATTCLQEMFENNKTLNFHWNEI